MAGLLEAHVRPGLAKSEGAKHKTVPAANWDILDNCRFHGESSDGASLVRYVLGKGVNEHLVPLPDGHYWLSICDDGKGMGKSTIEWGLLSRGPAERPDGTKIVSYFNTGHHAAFNKLGGLEVIIATVRDGTGTLVRWGKTVVDALNRVSPPADPSETRVLSAYLQFDMRNGARLMGQASASLEAGPAADSSRSISEAAFGLCGPDMQFPMRNVTPAKLLSSLRRWAARP